MGKEDLKVNEYNKYLIIKELVENDGNKNRASIKLNCSIRTVNRLIKRYKDKGISGFSHGNNGRKPATTFDDETKEKIISLYQDEYSDANIVHFTEIVREDLNIEISDSTIRKWLRERNILSPKAHKATRRALKKELKKQMEEEPSVKKKKDIEDKIESVSRSEAHPIRPRKKYEGEMVQMDASSYLWVPEAGIWHLHIAVDDASGDLVGAYFDFQETLNGYYNVLYQILNTKGIPFMFYTDRRTVFEYRRKSRAFDDEDTFTQFAYACHRLGIEIKTTSVPQAKGRVERMNETLQSRLPVELRRAGIKDIESANEFLKSYVKKFNKQHSLQHNSIKSVYEKQPTPEEINRILAVIDERVVQSGHCIKYKNEHYAITNSTGTRIYFKKGTSAMIINCFDGSRYVNIDDKLYLMEKIPEHEAHSENFDQKPTVEKPKKVYIPPVDHPWRQNSWRLFSKPLKQRLYGVYN